MIFSKGRDRGAIALEGVMALGLAAVMMIFQMELARRGALEVMLHHGAFWQARAGVFGEAAVRTWKRQWKSVAGAHRVRFRLSRADGRCLARAYVRLPTLTSFPLRDYRRHHIEVTRQCSFPLSSP